MIAGIGRHGLFNQALGHLLLAHQPLCNLQVFGNPVLVAATAYIVSLQATHVCHQHRIGAIGFAEAERKVIELESQEIGQQRPMIIRFATDQIENSNECRDNGFIGVCNEATRRLGAFFIQLAIVSMTDTIQRLEHAIEALVPPVRGRDLQAFGKAHDPCGVLLLLFA